MALLRPANQAQRPCFDKVDQLRLSTDTLHSSRQTLRSSADYSLSVVLIFEGLT
ncbi:hypothetical protein [Spirosoma lituiforme]